MHSLPLNMDRFSNGYACTQCTGISKISLSTTKIVFLLRSEEYVILKKEEWMKERIDIS